MKFYGTKKKFKKCNGDQKPFKKWGKYERSNEQGEFTNKINSIMLYTFSFSWGQGQKTAEIENVLVDDVYENNQKGMRIYIDFSVDNMLDKQGSCVAWFYFSDGTELKDYNSNYNTTDGQVSTSEDFEPGYINAVYTDFELFMPYDELHLDDGESNLKFYIGIFDNNNKLMTTSEDEYFDFNQ